MSIRFYMDVHVRRAVTEGLRLRQIDVLTAQEDNAGTFDDEALFDRATELERVLFTQDDDLLRLAKQRQQRGLLFSGVIYAHQLNITVGQCIADLELIAKTIEPIEMMNTTIFLPL